MPLLISSPLRIDGHYSLRFLSIIFSFSIELYAALRHFDDDYGWFTPPLLRCRFLISFWLPPPLLRHIDITILFHYFSPLRLIAYAWCRFSSRWSFSPLPLLLIFFDYYWLLYAIDTRFDIIWDITLSAIFLLSLLPFITLRCHYTPDYADLPRYAAADADAARCCYCAAFDCRRRRYRLLLIISITDCLFTPIEPLYYYAFIFSRRHADVITLIYEPITPIYAATLLPRLRHYWYIRIFTLATPILMLCRYYACDCFRHALILRRCLCHLITISPSLFYADARRYWYEFASAIAAMFHDVIDADRTTPIFIFFSHTLLIIVIPGRIQMPPTLRHHRLRDCRHYFMIALLRAIAIATLLPLP